MAAISFTVSKSAGMQAHVYMVYAIYLFLTNLKQSAVRCEAENIDAGKHIKRCHNVYDDHYQQ